MSIKHLGSVQRWALKYLGDHVRRGGTNSPVYALTIERACGLSRGNGSRTLASLKKLGLVDQAHLRGPWYLTAKGAGAALRLLRDMKESPPEVLPDSLDEAALSPRRLLHEKIQLEHKLTDLVEALCHRIHHGASIEDFRDVLEVRGYDVNAIALQTLEENA